MCLLGNVSWTGSSAGEGHSASGIFKRGPQLCHTTRCLSPMQRTRRPTESSYCDSVPSPGKRYCVYLIVFSWIHVASAASRKKKPVAIYRRKRDPVLPLSTASVETGLPESKEKKNAREKAPVRDCIAALSSSSSRLSKCGSRSGALGGMRHSLISPLFGLHVERLRRCDAIPARAGMLALLIGLDVTNCGLRSM